MRTRLVTAADVPALLPLMADFNASEGIPWKRAKVGKAFRRLCDEPDLGFALVAENGSPIGYVVVTFNYDLEHAGRDAFVTELYVARASRWQGVAKALLKAAEKEARRCSVKALHLLVSPQNRAARALYAGVGFMESPRITMTKLLGGLRSA
jgi:ribosomal protein S18 acetylase RimI-like enzyme